MPFGSLMVSTLGKPGIFKDEFMARKIILAVTASLFALTATACNTVRGAGQDLESVANDVDAAI